MMKFPFVVGCNAPARVVGCNAPARTGFLSAFQLEGEVEAPRTSSGLFLPLSPESGGKVFPLQ